MQRAGLLLHVHFSSSLRSHCHFYIRRSISACKNCPAVKIFPVGLPVRAAACTRNTTRQQAFFSICSG
jgi:hypothetical protein